MDDGGGGDDLGVRGGLLSAIVAAAGPVVGQLRWWSGTDGGQLHVQ